jgi:hypothetical protein
MQEQDDEPDPPPSQSAHVQYSTYYPLDEPTLPGMALTMLMGS